MSDRFLGAWAVTEYVFSPASVLIGTVKQQRRLYTENSGHLVVEQHCQPSSELLSHPMGSFAGDFRFRLAKEGRERCYLGPDVQGAGTSFGGIYLLGEGVWPRFGYNFRSWSISVSASAQLTGGVFFRGASVEAIILGVGTLQGEAYPFDVLKERHIRSGPGLSSELDLATQLETGTRVERQRLGQDHWREWGEHREDVFQLEPRPAGFMMNRRHAIGSAVAYGPLLYWETFGTEGDCTQGLDIQQFSLRRHFQRGRLIRLEGLQFSEEKFA